MDFQVFQQSGSTNNFDVAYVISADFLFAYLYDSTDSGAAEYSIDKKIEIVGTSRDSDCEAFIGWEIGNNDYSFTITTHASAKTNEFQGVSKYSFVDEDPTREIKSG